MDGETSGRWEISASHKIKIKYKVAVKDVVEPIEDTTFHIMKVSG